MASTYNTHRKSPDASPERGGDERGNEREKVLRKASESEDVGRDNGPQNGRTLSGIASGFEALDRMTSGWQKADLILIAGRHAMGKTAFAISMAKHIAVQDRHPIAIFSLEHSSVQFVNRMVMNFCEITGDTIKTGRITREESARINAQLHDAPFYIDDTPSLSIFELRAKARRLVREKRVELILIDYLQLLNAEGMRFDSREQELSFILHHLKTLAQELELPIIALCHLAQGIPDLIQHSQRSEKPQLSDLRQSDIDEQDADVVCFLHRPERYHCHTDEATGKDLRGLAELIVAKQRGGVTGEVFLRFRPQFAQFLNEGEDVDGSEG